jgi:CMP/dCMP kinase
VRARRRTAEMALDPAGAEASVEADLLRRDELDSTRAAAPLAQASDAVVLDTTSMPLDEVVSKLAVMAVDQARLVHEQ